MKLQEIADRINDLLRKFEGDPAINIVNRYGTRTYFRPSAFAAGSKVKITYISYQGASCLSRAEALKYLQWLEAGNVGKHWGYERRQDNERAAAKDAEKD